MDTRETMMMHQQARDCGTDVMMDKKKNDQKKNDQNKAIYQRHGDVMEQNNKDKTDEPTKAKTTGQVDTFTMDILPFQIPKCGDTSMVRVDRVDESVGLYVSLLEYPPLTGLVNPDQVSVERKKSRLPSVMRFCKVGDTFPCKIVGVSVKPHSPRQPPQPHPHTREALSGRQVYIDLSKKDMTVEESEYCTARHRDLTNALDFVGFLCDNVPQVSHTEALEHLVRHVVPRSVTSLSKWCRQTTFADGLKALTKTVPQQLDIFQSDFWANASRKKLAKRVHKVIKQWVSLKKKEEQEAGHPRAALSTSSSSSSSSKKACVRFAPHAKGAEKQAESEAECGEEPTSECGVEESDEKKMEKLFCEVGQLVRDGINAISRGRLSNEHVLDSVKLQVFSLKHNAEDQTVTLTDCLTAILRALLETSIARVRRNVDAPTRALLEEAATEVENALSAWSGVLRSFVEPCSQVEVLFWLEEFAQDAKFGSWVRPMFPRLLSIFYDEAVDVVDEDAILAWEELRSASDAEEGDVISMCQSFLNWLKE